MAHEGQLLEGPGGFRLRLVRIRDDELEMEAVYGGGRELPPEHLHPQQRERFEVLDGAVRAVIAGDERRYGAGEVFEIPAGTPHQMTGDGPARTRWVVAPALRTPELFERLYTILADPARGGELPALLAEYGEEIRFTALG